MTKDQDHCGYVEADTPMREKIARALWDSREARMPAFTRRAPDEQDFVTGAWQLALDDADAVLAALMEPSEAMLEAGMYDCEQCGTCDMWRELGSPEGIWQAMIRAAGEG